MSSGQAYWHDKWDLEYQQEQQRRLKLQAEDLQVTVEMLKTLKEFKAFWASNKKNLPYGVVSEGDRILDKLGVKL